MSWNGATQVAAWELLAGPSARRLTRAALVARAGFETTVSLAVRPGERFVQARALDAAGAALGSSAAVVLPATARRSS
jgi:hypothetical protein